MALHAAARAGDLDELGRLAGAAGADLEAPDKLRRTALHLAAHADRPESVGALPPSARTSRRARRTATPRCTSPRPPAPRRPRASSPRSARTSTPRCSRTGARRRCSRPPRATPTRARAARRGREHREADARGRELLDLAAASVGALLERHLEDAVAGRAARRRRAAEAPTRPRARPRARPREKRRGALVAADEGARSRTRPERRKADGRYRPAEDEATVSARC